MTRLPLLTTSRAKAYRACPRLHHLEYQLGVRPLEVSENLRFGTLLHLGLEAWWRAPAAERLAAGLDALRGAGDVFELHKARALLLGYDARWAAVEMTVLAVEAQFEAPLINPQTGAASKTWTFAGKLDAVAVVEGRTVVVEHKTTSEDITLGSTYWRRLRMDPQISNYLVGARALGFEATEVLYDVIAKPALRPLKATPLESRRYVQKTGALYANQRAVDETPEEYADRIISALCAEPDAYFARAAVVRLEKEREEAAWDLWATGRAIREDELAARATRNPDACQRYGRTCWAFDVCSGAASLDDTTRFRRIDPEHPHEELAPNNNSERGAA